MITIPVFQTLVFGLYLWWIVVHFGILPSISQSWYEEAQVKGKKKKWLFILFIASISASTALLGYLTHNIWFEFSGGSLAIVALAPAFRSEHKMVGILHTGGTVLGIAFACYALLTHGVYFPVIGCAICSVLFERVKISNTTFWVEIADFYFIEVGIFQLITLGV